MSVLEDGSLEVSFNYESTKNILPFLLMFGRHVKILSPQWLKNEYRNEIKFIYES
ncbi:WYL domain-containing protein [Paenibacillus alginolyticus]|uniref:WYL domain-containing protein n=1 Tax=Paenibacillus alginolyticus TaxID=59839 RepID=UPI0028ADFD25|nr:WYL domain-containing protein [Paenibacillus frigoriresistens]